MDLGALIASVAVSVGTVVAGYLVARRFQKLGGGEAQDRLNKIRADLDEAMQDKLALLEADFSGCKGRLMEVEAIVASLRTDAEAAAKKWGRERIDFRSEITDLHAELRTLRTDRKGAADRSSD